MNVYKAATLNTNLQNKWKTRVVWNTICKTKRRCDTQRRNLSEMRKCGATRNHAECTEHFWQNLWPASQASLIMSLANFWLELQTNLITLLTHLWQCTKGISNDHLWDQKQRCSQVSKHGIYCLWSGWQRCIQRRSLMGTKDHQNSTNVAFTKPLTTHLTHGKKWFFMPCNYSCTHRCCG